jgi:hypothetical protein
VARTLPIAAALQQSGLLDFTRDGLGLRIAESFAPMEHRHIYPPQPFPLNDCDIDAHAGIYTDCPCVIPDFHSGF